jgi:hypothetical protein
MEKLHVAFLLRDMQFGGVESVLTRTLTELVKHKDIEIFLITYAEIKEPIYVEYFKNHPQIKCYSLYPCSWLGTKLPHFFLFKIFLHFIRDIYRKIKRRFVIKKFKDIDVFIDYHDFGFVDELKYIKDSKKIAWFHSSIDVFMKRKFINNLKYYNKLVVLTDECANELKQLYPKFSDKISRIYNPIDIKSVQKKAKEKNKINGKYFCSVSRLTPDKDIKTLLNGFDLFWKQNKKPNVKLIIIGDGNKADEYKKYANGLKSKQQIIFVGKQKNPFVYIKNASANILSSYGEGLPTTLIESMALGTLNISSNCKYGPREILLDGRGGLLFEPGNANQLAKLLTDVYKNKVNIKRMIDESTKSLVRFDADNVIKEIISLIS